MKLVKTTFFSAVITFVRISSGFVVTKAIATFTGPGGVALIGAFTNFISIILTFANGAVNTGVIKYTAEYNNDEDKLKSLFSTAFKITLYCSLIIGGLLILFAPFLSLFILTNVAFANVIRIFGCSILFYALNSLLISILNGKGEIKLFTIINTVGSLFSLFFTIGLVYFFRIQGALYALVLAQSLIFFVTSILIIKSKSFNLNHFKQSFNKTIAIKLSHYSIMAIVSALTVPVSQIILRNLIILKLGVNSAGYWQGIMRISDGYLMLITTALSTYYLPKLSSLKTNTEIRNEIFKGYKIILPSVFIGCVIIYFLRYIIIEILFTPDFSNMEDLFLWQFIGDFFKMAAWVLAYLMLAKALTKLFIITEIVFSISYIIIGYFCLRYYGLQGISIAFGVNYFIYLITMLIIFRKLIFNQNG